MNCKYCGAALPTKGGVCPECGRMIPISQQKEMNSVLDPRWNMYRNKDTAMYKSMSNEDKDKKLGKVLVLIIIIVVAIILIMVFKGGA